MTIAKAGSNKKQIMYFMQYNAVMQLVTSQQLILIVYKPAPHYVLFLYEDNHLSLLILYVCTQNKLRTFVLCKVSIIALKRVYWK